MDISVGFGGAVHSLVELVNGLTRLEDPAVKVHVLTFQEPHVVEDLFSTVTHHNERWALDYRARWRFNRWAARWGPLEWVWWKLYAVVDSLQDWWLSRRIRALIREWKIDLVHVNNASRFAMQAASAMGLPLLVHIRGQRGDESVHAYHARISRRAEPTQYVAVSQAIADGLTETGVLPERVDVVHNAVDLERFEGAAERGRVLRRELGFGPEDVVLGVFGRVIAWKGQRELLQACLRLFPDDPHLHLLIVGDGADAGVRYFEELKDEAASGPAAGRVHFTGYQKDVEAYYQACDIVVHSSIELEPFGRVVIEGMACGKALIAMAEGGPLDVVTDGVDGLLVPPRDIDALADAIQSLAASPETRARLGAAARETVRREFTTMAAARAIHAHYVRMMEER